MLPQLVRERAISFEGKKLGVTGEDLAAELIQQKKYKILRRNLRTKFGEVDILAADGKQIVIVEVKAKTSDRLGAAIEMITPTKQRKLILLAHELQMKYQTESVRIDIVTVDQAQDEPILKHYKGIVEFHG